MKFMIMLYERPTDWESVPAERRDSALADHDAFTAWLRERGIPYYGEAVAPPEKARTLRRKEGELVAEDGPYAPGEAHLGGFYVIDVPSMAEAEEIARRCPTGTGTEIRPIWASAR